MKEIEDNVPCLCERLTVLRADGPRKGALLPSGMDFDEYIMGKEKPVNILFVGVNGTGKTTSIAKVARYLMNQN